MENNCAKYPSTSQFSFLTTAQTSHHYTVCNASNLLYISKDLIQAYMDDAYSRYYSVYIEKT